MQSVAATAAPSLLQQAGSNLIAALSDIRDAFDPSTGESVLLLLFYEEQQITLCLSISLCLCIQQLLLAVAHFLQADCDY